MSWIAGLISDAARETLVLRLFGLTRIPLLFYVRASVREMTPERAVVRIALRRRTRNHLGSMYFGALCIGADCAVGALAMRAIRRQDKRISMIFKGLHADFLRRAEGDVEFVCAQGEAIAAFVAAAATAGERVEREFEVTASVPALGPEPVATFRLMLSLKNKSA